MAIVAPSSGLAAQVAPSGLRYPDGSVQTTASTPGGVSDPGDVNVDSGNAGGAGDIIFATKTVERARITTAGFFGVGTATPAYPLDVHGAISCLNYTGTGVVTAGVVSAQPVLELYRIKDAGTRTRMWQAGLDLANDAGDGLLSSYFFARGYQDGTTSVQDGLFFTDYNVSGVGAPLVAFGVGYTPPPSGYRLAVSAPDGTNWGAYRARIGAGTTGPIFTALDSAGNQLFQVGNTGGLTGIANGLSTLGLAVNSINDASRVLTVVGSATASTDLFRVNVSGAAGRWSISRDGTTNVQLALVGSGGPTTVAFRTQTKIAALTANAAGDNILVLKMAATPSAAPFIIQTSAPATLFQIDQTGNMTLADAGNVVLGSATGTKIGTATTQKLGFFNKTPIVQPATAGTTAGYTVGVSTPVTIDGTFTGGTGASAYTIADVVLALKTLGLIAA